MDLSLPIKGMTFWYMGFPDADFAFFFAKTNIALGCWGDRKAHVTAVTVCQLGSKKYSKIVHILFLGSKHEEDCKRRSSAGSLRYILYWLQNSASRISLDSYLLHQHYCDMWGLLCNTRLLEGLNYSVKTAVKAWSFQSTFWKRYHRNTPGQLYRRLGFQHDGSAEIGRASCNEKIVVCLQGHKYAGFSIVNVILYVPQAFLA